MDAVLRYLAQHGLDDGDDEQTLESLDLPGIVKYIKSKPCKNIFVMVGEHALSLA